eukprot:scaffold93005_cov45-Phaeocystis_antarctica.AAC.1
MCGWGHAPRHRGRRGRREGAERSSKAPRGQRCTENVKSAESAKSATSAVGAEDAEGADGAEGVEGAESPARGWPSERQARAPSRWGVQAWAGFRAMVPNPTPCHAVRACTVPASHRTAGAARGWARRRHPLDHRIA